MSNYKLARVGVGSVLADFDTKIVKVFNSAGRYLNDGISGTPRFMETAIISLVQAGSSACVYDGVTEKHISSAPQALKSLMGTPFLVYPLQLESRTPKGVKYKQFIFCYGSSEVRDSIFSGI